MERLRFLQRVSDKDLAKAQEFSVERNWKSSLRKAGKKAALVGSGLVFIASVNLGSVNNTDASYPDQPSPTPLPKPTLVVKDKLSSPLVINKEVSKISKESTTNLEAQEVIINNYSIDDLEVDQNGNLIGLSTFSDGIKHVIAGELDSLTGTLNITEKGVPPFYPLATIRSETDPNIMVVVGDKGRMEDKGRVWLTKDGGTTWQIIEHDQGGTMFRTQITPDNIFSFISASGHYETQVIMARLNLSDNSIVDLPVNGAQGGQGIGSMTAYTKSNGSNYSNYGTLPLSVGYFKFTNTPTEIQAQQLNPQEGYTYTDLVQFTDPQGKNRIWLNDPDTHGIPPNDPNMIVATTHDNVENIPRYDIQPITSLYNTGFIENGGFYTSSAAVDTNGNKGYLGEIVIGITEETRVNAHKSYIEEFPIDNPLDPAQHKLMSNDGLPLYQSNLDMIDIKSLKFIERDGKKFLVANVSRTQWVIEPGRAYFVFKEGGIFLKDITNGDNPTDVWKKMSLKMTITEPKPINKTFLPFIQNNSR